MRGSCGHHPVRPRATQSTDDKSLVKWGRGRTQQTIDSMSFHRNRASSIDEGSGRSTPAFSNRSKSVVEGAVSKSSKRRQNSSRWASESASDSQATIRPPVLSSNLWVISPVGIARFLSSFWSSCLRTIGTLLSRSSGSRLAPLAEVPLGECSPGTGFQILLEANRGTFIGEFHRDDDRPMVGTKRCGRTDRGCASRGGRIRHW
jgi:hypothetical protein